MRDTLVDIGVGFVIAALGLLITGALRFGDQRPDRVEEKWQSGVGLALVVSLLLHYGYPNQPWWLPLGLITVHLGVIAMAVLNRHPWGAIAIFLAPGVGDVCYLIYTAATRPEKA